jgi:hypothetical protein
VKTEEPWQTHFSMYCSRNYALIDSPGRTVFMDRIIRYA